MSARWTIYVCECGNSYDATPFDCQCGPGREVEVCPVAGLERLRAEYEKLADFAADRGDFVIYRGEYEALLRHRAALRRIGDESDPLDGMDSAQFARLTLSLTEMRRGELVDLEPPDEDDTPTNRGEQP